LVYIRRVTGPPVAHEMMAVTLKPGSPLAIGQPRRLFAFDPRVLQFSCAPVRCFDVAPDGQRFYAVQVPKPQPPPVVTHISLIVNWLDELRTKVPVSK
jgi:hypothetical protein